MAVLPIDDATVAAQAAAVFADPEAAFRAKDTVHDDYSGAGGVYVHHNDEGSATEGVENQALIKLIIEALKVHNHSSATTGTNKILLHDTGGELRVPVAAPGTPANGHIYFDPATQKLHAYVGSTKYEVLLTAS